MTQTPFQLPTGLVADDTTFAAPGRWRDAQMVRFYENNWQVRFGWEQMMLDLLGGVCRAVFCWSDQFATLNVAFGTHATLEIWSGGAHVDITPVSFLPGAIDGAGGAGYGTGAWNVGPFGAPSTASYFPLTWSLGAFGVWLMANPRGQTIFYWQNVLANKAIPLPNAPAQVTYMLCVPQRQVMAFGCNEEVSGVFNQSCIRFSDIEDPTVWNTLPSNNAGEVILPGGGRIVCARLVGNYVFVWTETALFLGTYIGSPDQTWSFDKVADNCGSISPGAPIVKAQLATWISPDGQFYACVLGGVPQIVPCPIRTDLVGHVSTGQQDKIVGGTISTYGELTWFYPDARDGLECSRDITVSQQGWCRGRLARTAWADSGPQPYPVGTGPGRMAYWHEKGNSQDGAPLTGFIESNDFYLSEAAGGVMVNGVWPDFRQQQGVLQLTIFTKDWPQGAERQHGPFTMQPGMLQKSIRVAGRIARIRYDWSAAPCYARAGRQEFDVAAIGGR
jgi:hypothetical protein